MNTNNVTYGKFLSNYYDILYAHKFGFIEKSHAIIQLLKKYGLTTSNTILDIGCGTGGHALYIASAGYSVFGIDISPYMIYKAQKKCSKKLSLDFQCLSIDQLPKKNHFTHAYSLNNVINCLQDKSDLITFLNHISEKILPGGIFIFECWNAETVLRTPPFPIQDTIKTNKIVIQRTVQPTLIPHEEIVYLDYLYEMDNTKELIRHRIKLFSDQFIRETVQSTGFNILFMFDNIKTQQPVIDTTRERCYIVQKQ